MAVTLLGEIVMCANNPLNAPDFYLGRAITKLEEDRLGRSGFAEHLADAIAAYHGREGLVLAVNAPWGDGKTSLKNMVCDALQKNHSGHVVPLAFNPWEWASQNQVSEAFFAELAKQIETKDPSNQARESAKRLRRLGRHLGLASRVLTPAGALLNLGFPGASLMTTFLAKGLSEARTVARDAAEGLEEAAADARKTLPTMKEDLRVSLADYLGATKKLLVVIDDIDRLSPEEIRLVLQLVKVNADFPGVVFFLLFDTAFVLKALEGVFEDRAREFLEKIVQFQMDLPSLRDDAMRTHVWSALQRIFDGRESWLRLCNRERFDALWNAGLAHYLTNLRQADRLVHSFEFHVGVYRSEAAEVNPLDLLAVETLRLFESGVYAAIRSSARLLFPLLGELDDSIELDQQSGSSDELVSGHAQRRKAGWEKLLKTLADKAGDSTRESCLQLLWWLFPERVDRNPQFGPTEQHHSAARDKRISSLLYFARYFQLAIDEEDVADRDIVALAGMVDEPERFVAELGRYKEAGLLCLALTKLLASERLSASSSPEELIGLLLDFREAAGEVPSADHHLRFADAIERLVDEQLSGLETSPARCDCLFRAIHASKAVKAVVDIAWQERKKRWDLRDLPTLADQGVVLAEKDLLRLDEVVADRLQPVLTAGLTGTTDAWLRSLRWFLEFQPKRARAISAALLTNPMTVGIMLRLLVRDELADRISTVTWDEVMTPLIVNSVRWKPFDAALKKHEEELGNLVAQASKRIQVARMAHAEYIKQTSSKKKTKKKADGSSVQDRRKR